MSGRATIRQAGDVAGARRHQMGVGGAREEPLTFQRRRLV